MANIENSCEIKYKIKNENFEVLVDFEKLKDFQKDSTNINVFDVLKSETIFKDQKKGLIASENTLKEIFKNLSKENILKEILLKGKCQIPTSYLNKLREEKKIQVINFICENTLNPQTKNKYTHSMIESQVNKIKYNFDPNKAFEIQAEQVLDLLKKIMPISEDKICLEIKIKPEFIGSFYGNFRKFAKVIKENYDKDSNLILEIQIRDSLKDKIIEMIKNNSKNTASYFIK